MHTTAVGLTNDYTQVMKKIETALHAYHAQLKSLTAKAGVADVDTTCAKSPTVNILKWDADRGLSTPPVDATSTLHRRGSEEAVIPQAEVKRQEKMSHFQAFYVVGLVEIDSPASQAGLREGDCIVRFGTITKENRTAQAMSALVQHSIGQSIPVVVRRASVHGGGTESSDGHEGGRMVPLSLVPQKWTGKGLLGCRLDEIK